MADMTSAAIAITLAQQDRDSFGFAHKVSFPTIEIVNTTSLKYPANGIPLPVLGQFGMNKAIKFMELKAAGSGYEFKYDKARHTLRIYCSGASGTFTFDALAAHTHDLKVKGLGAGSIDEPIGVEGGDTLAKDAATDRTIAGANSATKGGVVAASAGTPSATGTLTDGPLGELATGADVPAVAGIIAMVIGN